jgi:uncharacterized protein YjbJ (UPF0337 family)
MSITSDLRAYADDALEQGKKVVRDTQSQLNDVTGQANEFVGKLTDTAKDNVAGLRAQAEKTLDLGPIKNAVEPYVAQARGYADQLLATARKDKRVAALLDSAESVTGAVVETVQERVVKPVQQLLGSAPKRRPARKSSKPAAKSTSRPATKATSKPAAKASSASKSTASAAKKTTTSARSTAKKAAAKATDKA